MVAACGFRALGLLGAEPEERYDDEVDIAMEEERRGDGDLSLPTARGLDHQHVGGPVGQRLDGEALVVARLEIPHFVEQRVDHLLG